MPTDHRDTLPRAQALAAELLSAVHNLDPADLVFHAPVIDPEGSQAWRQNEVAGWNKMMVAVERQAAIVEQLNQSGALVSEDQLPSLESLATLHRQLITAVRPITAVRTSMKLEPGTKRQIRSLDDSLQSLSMSTDKPDRKGKGRAEAHIDVIARGGAEWIKLWSKRESHLRTEFREMDSYVNSDWSDSDEEDEDGAAVRKTPVESNGNALMPKPLKNSLLELAEQLLYVAERIERPPWCDVPRITIRMTRMEEFPAGGHLDDRIPQTFAMLRSKGIRLEFGDLGEVPLTGSSPPVRRFSSGRPSLKINLDPTSLVGLCSDILHHPLPEDGDAAQRRFLRPKEVALSQGRPADKLQSKNSRELYKEILEEMRSPVLEHIRDTLQDALDAARSRGEDVQGIEFWASKEAVKHLREAMCSEEVIGEGMEQRRMRRLVGVEEGDFFEGSRYEGKAGCLQGIRIHVLPDELPSDRGTPPMCLNGIRSFHRSLSTISGQFLQDYYAFAVSPDTSVMSKEDLPVFLRPDKLPVPKIAQLSLSFPVVTLHAFHRGAAEGMTTLCFGNVTFRDLFGTPRWRLKGFAQSNYEEEMRRLLAGREGRRTWDEIEGNAAVWMLPYRSFAEGKRVRFEKGDYSYPQAVC